MKILSALIFIAVIGFSGCKKCYRCVSSSQTENICKGHVQYDNVRKGKPVTDAIGQEYKCY